MDAETLRSISNHDIVTNAVQIRSAGNYDPPRALRSVGGGAPQGRLRTRQSSTMMHSANADFMDGSTTVRASIPCRYETILNFAPQEKNGFGRRTLRFHDVERYGILDNPGPGSYAPSQRGGENPGISKLGHGAFASTSRPRDIPPLNYELPGPGNYEVSSLLDSSHSIRGKAIFAPRVACSILRGALVNGTRRHSAFEEDDATPGPGTYNLPPTLTVHEPQHLSAAFHAPHPKCVYQEDDEVPGPGHYSISSSKKEDYLRKTDHPKITHTSSQITNSILSDNHKLSCAEANRRMGALPPILQNENTDIPRTEFEVVTRFLPTDKALASPRSSRTKNSSMRRRKRNTWSFVKNHLDRFGNPIVRQCSTEKHVTPGPGSYTVLESRPKMLISSSWALSSTNRSSLHKDRWNPPGPAYYSPVVLPLKTDYRVTTRKLEPELKKRTERKKPELHSH